MLIVTACTPGELITVDPLHLEAGVSVSGVQAAVTTEQGGRAEYALFLNAQPEADVQIALSTSNSLEGKVMPAILRFTTDDWQSVRKVHVVGQDDAIDDGDVPYLLEIEVASEDERYDGFSAPEFALTNVDDDSAGVALSVATGLITHELGTAASFTVALDTQPAAGVRIVLGSSDETEGVLSLEELNFGPDDYGIAKTVTVTGMPDGIPDGDVPFEITGTVHSSDPNYNASESLLVQLTNQDFHIERLPRIAEDHSSTPRPSLDGRFVTYVSGSQVVIADRTLATMKLVSAVPGLLEVPGNRGAYHPDISGDGAYVVFDSAADDLVADDQNGLSDIFLRDVAAESTARLTISPLGEEADDSSSKPKISRDGRYVVFDTDATNLFEPILGSTNVLRYDRVEGAAVRVSEGRPGGWYSFNRDISADGRFVVLNSRHPYVEDDNDYDYDVYVRDLLTGELDRASVATVNAGAVATSREAALSADGSTVVFAASGSGLVDEEVLGSSALYVRDREARTTHLLHDGDVLGTIAVSGDGRIVAFRENGHAFVLNRELGLLRRADHGVGGVEANGTVIYGVALSGDGKVLTFSSDASNLVPDDTNGFRDVFVVELSEGFWRAPG